MVLSVKKGAAGSGRTARPAPLSSGRDRGEDKDKDKGQIRPLPVHRWKVRPPSGEISQLTIPYARLHGRFMSSTRHAANDAHGSFQNVCRCPRKGTRGITLRCPLCHSPCFLSLECRQAVIGLLQGGGDDYLELPHPSALGQLPFLEACLLLAAQP